MNGLNEEISDAYEHKALMTLPKANVLSKEDFEKRAEMVFETIWKILSKSFGPGGAPTIISNYPYIHTTKDGFTIAKNISMDASTSVLDQAIADMAFNICGRLNYSVGDGTTTAIIATYQLYHAYREAKDEIKKLTPFSYQIMDTLSKIKDVLIDYISRETKEIRSQEPKKLASNIADVVYVSSNGNQPITDMISSLYGKLMYPAINCMIAPDGITKSSIINGYKLNISLSDKLYINQDNGYCEQKDCDVIIFSTKINTSIYQNILVPLNEYCRICGRHLIVVAPNYDTVTIGQIIQRELTNEYRAKKDVNMILTVCKSNNAHDRKRLEDFAMLCNTIVLDRALIQTIFDELAENHGNPLEYFALDNRKIPGTAIITEEGVAYYTEENPIECSRKYKENAIRVGHVNEASIGMESSTFSGFNYDQNMYDIYFKDAEKQLEEDEEKYQKLGTFNVVVNQDQERLYSLGLKMGVIEVGGDSEMNQKFLKDAVDDSVKAASSAFKHGVVLGCNVTLINCITKYINECINHELPELEKTLTKMVLHGFVSVYKTMLENVFEDVVVFNHDEKNNGEYCAHKMRDIPVVVKDYSNDVFGKNVFERDDYLYQALDWIIKYLDTEEMTIQQVIIAYSVVSSTVFDVRNLVFTKDIVNSVETDKQVLTATTDLLSILIAGNQMVLTGKHNF